MVKQFWFQNITPEVKVQLRENQRRSRARRQELIEDLQKRVQDYEERGIQATVEMQQAARDVALENQHLRQLLDSRGVTQEEVESYLSKARQSQLQHDRPINNQHTNFATTPSTDGSPYASVGHAASTEPDVPVPDAPNCARNENVDEHHRDELQESRGDGQEDRVLRVPQNSACHAPSAPGASTARMETSCDAAASIIADLQGHQNTDVVFAALGCSEGKGCVVKNVKIFELMDQISN
jgi:hypothetical protein